MRYYAVIGQSYDYLWVEALFSSEKKRDKYYEPLKTCTIDNDGAFYYTDSVVLNEKIKKLEN